MSRWVLGWTGSGRLGLACLIMVTGGEDLWYYEDLKREFFPGLTKVTSH